MQVVGVGFEQLRGQVTGQQVHMKVFWKTKNLSLQPAPQVVWLGMD